MPAVIPRRTACRGAGLGLRIPHIQYILAEKPDIPWFEVHICNFLGGGLNRTLLQEINTHYPISFHGVSLNLGGCDPLDKRYLAQLRQATDELSPGLVSEHACLTAHDGEHLHDLIPVPFTEQAARYMAERVTAVQDCLDRRILLENLSRYAQHDTSQMSEAEFLCMVTDLSGCGLLLDLNNAYINQVNLGESLEHFLSQLPLDRVGEIHLAGHTQQGNRLIDTHSTRVCDDVWDIYQHLALRLPDTPVLIEWDSDLPPFQTLMEEQDKAQALLKGAKRDK